MISDELFGSFRDSLYSGQYNLLLGSGVSLGSRNQAGQGLKSADQLRSDLCALTGARASTSLPRVYSLLNPQQRQQQITEMYLGCTAGDELDPLPRYVWKRILTFNVDDVLQALYAKHKAAQNLITLNFDSEFRPDTNKSEVQCVHLHGHVRSPDSGYVFSHSEYVAVMKEINAWMVLLSAVLPAEPFIIAGASLDEVDLAYYVSRRTKATPRRGRGPSLLIEPYPDAATVEDCRKYDLVLVKATMGDFLSWLAEACPTPPSPLALTVRTDIDVFKDEVAPSAQLRFFSDFELVEARTESASARPSPFRYGAEPTWTDIWSHLDIERSIVSDLSARVQQWLAAPKNTDNAWLISDLAATGKTTALKRLGCDLAALGHTVFAVRTLSKIDVTNTAQCLAQLKRPVVLLVDDFANHVEQVSELRLDHGNELTFVVVGAERSYRQAHVDVVGSELTLAVERLKELSSSERKQLVEAYRSAGLLALPGGDGRSLESAAEKLRGDAIAVAVCRLLNDFRPIDRIVESLWKATPEDHRRIYVCAALAHWCYGEGIAHVILQGIAGSHHTVQLATDPQSALALVANSNDDDYLVPQSAAIADRTLAWALKKQKPIVFDAFVGLAKGLAPWVNRAAIQQRTPEARTAGRLFDADKVVKLMLGDQAEAFYIEVKEEWEWNSRYWEQRALLVVDQDCQTAIQYARRAVSIEPGAFALTTLGKILFRSLDLAFPFEEERHSLCEEAVYSLNSAIEKEKARSRVTIHPFMSLVTGATKWLASGESLTPLQSETVVRNKEAAKRRFASDATLMAAIARLEHYLGETASSPH